MLPVEGFIVSRSLCHVFQLAQSYLLRRDHRIGWPFVRVCDGQECAKMLRVESVWGQDRCGSDLSQNTDKDFNVAILPFVHQRVSVGRQILEDRIAQRRNDRDMSKGDKGNLHLLGSRSHQTQRFGHEALLFTCLDRRSWVFS